MKRCHLIRAGMVVALLGVGSAQATVWLHVNISTNYYVEGPLRNQEKGGLGFWELEGAAFLGQEPIVYPTNRLIHPNVAYDGGRITGGSTLYSVRSLPQMAGTNGTIYIGFLAYHPFTVTGDGVLVGDLVWLERWPGGMLPPEGTTFLSLDHWLADFDILNLDPSEFGLTTSRGEWIGPWSGDYRDEAKHIVVKIQYSTGTTSIISVYVDPNYENEDAWTSQGLSEDPLLKDPDVDFRMTFGACWNSEQPYYPHYSEVRVADTWEEMFWYRINYEAGAGGSLIGPTSQIVHARAACTSVTAVASAYYQFVGWSDGNTNATRVDTNITASATYRALFEPVRTSRGTPLIWYVERGITNDFETFDTTDFSGDGFTGRQKYIMGVSNLWDTNELFGSISLVHDQSGLNVKIPVSKTNRVYVVERATSLLHPTWEVVTNMFGTDGELLIPLPEHIDSGYFRAKVSLPEGE